MKFAIFVAISFVALVGTGLFEVQGFRVQLSPRGPEITKHADQPFKIHCTIVPFDLQLFFSLKWRGPHGGVISKNSGESITVIRYNRFRAFALSFRKPSMNESGRYECYTDHQDMMLSDAINVEVIDSVGTTCPRNSYLSKDQDRCLMCPPNSKTVSAGSRSLRDCVCSPGYKGNPSKAIPCLDIDECYSDNFGCSHSCINTQGGAYCVCPRGYHLQEDNRTCADVNECLREDLNKCNHICHNTNGGFECSCRPGYVLVDGYRCEGCRRNSYRTNDEEFCVDCPPHAATDGPGKTSLGDCRCLPGFTGDPSRFIPCTDIDECHNNDLNCSHECINTPGSAHCSCPEGYQLDIDGYSCIDIDECSINNGGCEGKCVNFDGGFQCTCAEGYELSNIYSCIDIDECLLNNGDCSHHCHNFRGGYYCSCRTGFRLTSDQKSCVANYCARVPQPRHAAVDCYKKPVRGDARNEVLLDISEYYPNGTACYVKCDKGYKSSHERGYIQCTQNGEWSGDVPKCIAQMCPPLSDPEHGHVRPSSCKSRGSVFGKRCTFTCQKGYRLKGIAMLRCGSRNRWILHRAVNPTCERVNYKPNIQCTEDITAILEIGRNWTSIIVPGPQTTFDVQDIDVNPKWINVNSGTKFPVGSTEITFTARSALDLNLTGSCSVTVNVIDEEPPTVLFCPESFTVSGNGSSISWPPPIFADNVMVHSVTQNMKPGIKLQPGVHLIRYSASDIAGNEAVCEFHVNVTDVDCGFPNDPQNGKTSCEDWAYGRLCSVICDAGYVLYPPEPSIFSCDDSGIWDPTNTVQDCMPTTPHLNMTCPDGFELVVPGDSDSEICVECPPHLPWSEEEQKCANVTTI